MQKWLAQLGALLLDYGLRRLYSWAKDFIKRKKQERQIDNEFKKCSEIKNPVERAKCSNREFNDK